MNGVAFMLSPGEFPSDPAGDVATGEAFVLSHCGSVSLPETWSVSGSLVSGGLSRWLGGSRVLLAFRLGFLLMVFPIAYFRVFVCYRELQSVKRYNTC